LIRDDSHRPETLAAVRESLAGRPVDFLFLDGDHTYNGVRTDFEMYAPLVRPGGVIAFHDIVPNPMCPAIEVPRFWQELCARHRVREIVDRRDSSQLGMGIGVVFQA
jgi:predicted O-methyltransferase YrrM